jgi:hypothetical protein
VKDNINMIKNSKSLTASDDEGREMGNWGKYMYFNGKGWLFKVGGAVPQW